MENENGLRPKNLDTFFGQKEIVDRLKVFIYSAKQRNTCLDHLLFYGPPGLGKTSLAFVIANEMEAKIKTISAPSIEKISDLVLILSTIEAGDILFIDEIHRIAKPVEEILYSVLEDYKLNITYKTSEGCKALSLTLPPFTFIGATTQAGTLSTPLRDRFGIVFKFSYYSNDELTKIIQFNAKINGFKIDKKCAYEIAKRSRKTPRISNNLLKRIIDYSIFSHQNITLDLIEDGFDMLGIDNEGFADTDYQILKIFYEKFKNVPVSLETIAMLLNESITNISEINEPFLVNGGYIERTKRGRLITNLGISRYEFYKKQYDF